MRIGYLSETDKDYMDGIATALKSRGRQRKYEKLENHLLLYESVAPDALEAFKHKDFRIDEFVECWKSERRGRFSGEEAAKKYGAIILPELFLFVGMVAEKFKVPFGTAFIRMREEGMIKRGTNNAYRCVR